MHPQNRFQLEQYSGLEHELRLQWSSLPKQAAGDIHTYLESPLEDSVHLFPSSEDDASYLT